MVTLMTGYITMVFINNLLIPEMNLAHVQHVMTMDMLPTPSNSIWRSVNLLGIHKASFITIVILEGIAAIFCWLGAMRMTQKQHFKQGQQLATCGLTLGMVIWFGAFFIVGGEWFLAWQTFWGSLPSAIRVITMTGITLIFINLPENQARE